jgi:hypothetical protein
MGKTQKKMPFFAPRRCTIVVHGCVLKVDVVLVRPVAAVRFVVEAARKRSLF